MLKERSMESIFLNEYSRIEKIIELKGGSFINYDENVSKNVI